MVPKTRASQYSEKWLVYYYTGMEIIFSISGTFLYSPVKFSTFKLQSDIAVVFSCADSSVLGPLSYPHFEVLFLKANIRQI